MSSSPKTLYWCQRVSHFAKKKLPSEKLYPFGEKANKPAKQTLRNTAFKNTPQSESFFSGVIQWDGCWEQQSLPCSGSSASDLQTCFWWVAEPAHPYKGWAEVSGRGKSKSCTVPVLLEKHKCCGSCGSSLPMSQLPSALGWRGWWLPQDCHH